MNTSTRSITGIADTGLPLGRRKFAHVVLILAWLAFWLSSVLVPCCEAVAASLDGHAAATSQSVVAQSQTHHSNADIVEPPNHAPASPCGPTLNAEPITNGTYAGLPSGRADFICGGTNMLVTASHTSVNQSANRTLHAYHLPPRPPPANLRLFLQAQRLLI